MTRHAADFENRTVTDRHPPDDFARTPASQAPAPLVVAWVRLNHAALLDFWTYGASWNRREVSAFLDGLHKLP